MFDRLSDFLQYDVWAMWAVNVFLQAFVVALLGWGYLRLLRKRSIALQSKSGLALLVCLAALPMGVAWMAVLEWSLWKVNWGVDERIDSVMMDPLSEAVDLSMNDYDEVVFKASEIELTQVEVSTPRDSVDWWGIGGKVLLAVWFLGFVVNVARFGWLLRRFRELKDALVVVHDERVRGLFESLMTGVPELKRPLLLWGPPESSPFAFGVVRRAIVLPGDFRDLGDETLRSILAHEWAHLRNQDIVLGVFQQGLECFYWWNPFVAKLNQRFNLIREQLCDQFVLTYIAEPAAYARCLLQLIESKHAQAAPFVSASMKPDKTFWEERITSIVKKNRNDKNMKMKRIVESMIALIGLPSAVVGLMLCSHISMAERTVDESTFSSNEVAMTMVYNGNSESRPRFHLRGYYIVGDDGDYMFNIFDSEKKRSSWVRMDDPSSPYVLKSFDLKRQVLQLVVGDKEYSASVIGNGLHEEFVVDLPSAEKGSRVKGSEGGTLSVKANGESLSQLIRDVADAMKVNVVLPKEMSAEITVALEGVTVPQFLETVLYAEGYTYDWIGSIAYIREANSDDVNRGMGNTVATRESLVDKVSAGIGNRSDSDGLLLSSDETISVDFPGEKVSTIMRNIADLYGFNVSLPDSLSGEVNVKLRDVTWMEVLEVVSKMSGHDFRADGAAVVVFETE